MLCPIFIMLGWSLVLGVVLLVSIVLLVLDGRVYKKGKQWGTDSWGQMIADRDETFDTSFWGNVLLASVIFCALFILTPGYFMPRHEINVFVKTSEYITTHTPDDKLENVSLTQTKINKNTWLFKAQTSKEMFGVFSFYPDSVLELEPIQ